VRTYSDSFVNSRCKLCECRGADLMFPKPNDEPPFAPQASVITPVAHLVRLNLLRPPCAVRCRNTEMSRATVPEAPIDEDTDSCPWEHEIGGASQCGQRPQIFPESQAAPMKKASNCLLRCRFPPRVSLHHPPYESRRSSRGAATYGTHRPGTWSSTSSGISSSSSAATVSCDRAIRMR
jgi:hypothetical protein